MSRTNAKSSARRTARRTGTKRRIARKTASRARMRTKAPQRWGASHHREEDFQGGLRTYAKYRDLGIADATNGMVRAHVIRFIPPCRPQEVSKRHYHDVEFQMVYVLKGWIKTELEGQGAHVMRPGSASIQPPRIKHKVLDYSDDAEVLEIVLPADFETVELADWSTAALLGDIPTAS